MAEKEEEKGFVIKDRRRFSEEGSAEAEKEERAPRIEEKKAEEAGPQSGKAAQEESEIGPFPEVTMATFVFSLSSSALVHLGEIPEPETNISRVDLPIAK